MFNPDKNVTVEMSNRQRCDLLACVTFCLEIPNFADVDDLNELSLLRDMLANIPDADDANDVIHNFTA